MQLRRWGILGEVPGLGTTGSRGRERYRKYCRKEKEQEEKEEDNGEERNKRIENREEMKR